MTKEDAAVHAVDAEILGVMMKHIFRIAVPTPKGIMISCSCGANILWESEKAGWTTTAHFEHVAKEITARLKELG